MRQRDAWDESDLADPEEGGPRGYGRGRRLYEPDGTIQNSSKIDGVYRGDDYICREHYGIPVIHMCPNDPKRNI